MKIAKKLKSAETTKPKSMSKTDQDKLTGLTINECIERGLITSLGDDEGKFIFEHREYDAAYAIVNDCGVQVSKALRDADNLDEIIGDLRFTSGISEVEGEGKGQYWFRLGMPAGLNLGAEIYTLDAEAVKA